MAHNLYPNSLPACVTNLCGFASVADLYQRNFVAHKTSIVNASASVGARWGGKVSLVREVLGEAARLTRIRQFGAPLHQLIIRASELLEDLDEIQGLRPESSRKADKALRDKLRSVLEQLNSGIAAPIS